MGANIAEALGALAGLLGIPFVITLVIHRFDWRRADEKGFLTIFTPVYLVMPAANLFSTLYQATETAR